MFRNRPQLIDDKMAALGMTRFDAIPQVLNGLTNDLLTRIKRPLGCAESSVC